MTVAAFRVIAILLAGRVHAMSRPHPCDADVGAECVFYRRLARAPAGRLAGLRLVNPAMPVSPAPISRVVEGSGIDGTTAAFQ
jgi:hypothetical protein